MKRWRRFPGDRNRICAVLFITPWVLSNAWPAITGDPRTTLGEILKKHPDLLPRPLHEALSKVGGSALIEAHHFNQDQKPKREEAELLVGLAATVATYWSKKSDRPMAMRRAPTVA